MPFIDTLSNEERAYAANKGWDRLDDAAAAAAILKSYTNLERVRPAPAVVPAAPAEYVLDSVKLKTGEAPGDDILTFARGLAHQLKLPNEAATALAQSMVSYGEAYDASEAAKTATRLATTQAAWDAKAGANKESMEATASRALEAIGLTGETLETVKAALGVDKVMDLGHTLGTAMGEAPLLKGNNVPDVKTQSRTRQEALVERHRLTNDVEFQKKIVDGDSEANKLLETIAREIVGPQDNWSKAPTDWGYTRTEDGKVVAPQATPVAGA